MKFAYFFIFSRILIIMRRVYFSIAWFGEDGKASLKKLQDVIPIKVSDFIFFNEGSVNSAEETFKKDK